MTDPPPAADPALDLVSKRVVAVPVAAVRAAWTEPEKLNRWFAPQPWTGACEMDLPLGPVFATTMRGPDVQAFSGAGCWLAIEPRRRLVWTSGPGPGFRPAAVGSLRFTADIDLAPQGDATRYTASALHADPSARHAAMGFHTGGGAALDPMPRALPGGGLGR